MKYCQTVAVLALLSGAATMQAADYQHKASGLQFTVPKGWTCTEKDGTLNIANADKTLHVVGGVIPKEAGQAIFADIEKFLAKLNGLQNLKVTDGPKKEKVNGLEQAWYEGTGTYQDANGKKVKIEWDMTIISGGKGVLFLIGTGDLDKYEEVYEEFFESIQKIKDSE